MRQNVKVQVPKGAPLEPVAIRLGLNPWSWRTLKVSPAPMSPSAAALGIVAPRSVVVAPQAPEWTEITVRPGRIADRAALVDRVAEAIWCADNAHEACLAAKGVLVSRRDPPTPAAIPAAVKAAPKVPSAPVEPSADGELPLAEAPSVRRGPNAAEARRALALYIAPGKSIGAGAGSELLQRMTMLQPAGDGALPPTPAAPAVLHVAPEQWPYDPALVAATLRALRAQVKPCMRFR